MVRGGLVLAMQRVRRQGGVWFWGHDVGVVNLLASHLHLSPKNGRSVSRRSSEEGGGRGQAGGGARRGTEARHGVA